MKSIYSSIYLTVLVFSFVANCAHAEEEGAAGTSEEEASQRSTSSSRFFRRFIVEGSMVNAGYEGNESSRYTKPNGFSVGALLDLLGSANLVLETGAVYRQLGTTVNDGLADNSFTANYISVPVSAKYYFSGQEASSFYIKGGVMGSTLISDNTIFTSPTTQIGARSWEAAFLAGIGYKFALASVTDALLEVDYNRSISSVFPDMDIYRSDITGTLGFAFNL